MVVGQEIVLDLVLVDSQQATGVLGSVGAWGRERKSEFMGLGDSETPIDALRHSTGSCPTACSPRQARGRQGRRRRGVTILHLKGFLMALSELSGEKHRLYSK